MTSLDASHKEEETPHQRWLTVGFHTFLRLLSVVFLVFAILVWLRVIGYHDGPDMRFDTMNAQMKIGSAVLAVLFPVAAVGLWTTMAWGQVIWSMAVAFQLSTLVWYSGDFGLPRAVVWFHLVCIAIYLAFLVVLRFIHKKE